MLEDLAEDGALVSCTSHIGDEPHGEVELMFAQLDDRFDGVDLFVPQEFLGMLRSWRLCEVGQTADGEPLQIPEHLLAAERAAYPPLHQ